MKKMNSKLWLVLFTLCLPGWCGAAEWHSSHQAKDSLGSEYLRLHLNTSFFLTGESLLFKAYCFSRSGKLSGLSTIAYVELIGEDQRPLAQLKIVLKNGVGSGDFFFGANVPTGNYTLIAYTKWMRNVGDQGFFRSTLTVVNPAFKPETAAGQKQQSGVEPKNPKQGDGMSIRLEAKQYARRQKVTIHIPADTTGSRMLSVNARVWDTELSVSDEWERPTTVHPVLNQIHFLPDLRGEHITGVIANKSTGKVLAKELVSLSSPSKHFDYLVSTTDSAGRYHFSTVGMESDFALLKVHHRNAGDFTIAPENNFLQDYSSFVPPKFMLDTTMRALIERRYLPMQVENTFYAAKKDSIITNETDSRFFARPDKIYNLDDFMRFATMEDIFREIIPEILVKARDGKFSLTIMSQSTGERLSAQPLMLVDGIPISDANVVMRDDPLRVKTVAIVTRHYFYGGLETDGIISLETYDGDAKNVNVDEMFRLTYVPVLPSRIYYTPEYDGKKDLSRIPDFRTQLYWNPSIVVRSGEPATVTFYTNDVEGKYFVEIIGATPSGKLIYWRETFEVK
jgi:hypothetical protein